MFSLSGLMDAYAAQFGFTAQEPPRIADLLESDLEELDYDAGWEAIVRDFRRVENCIGKAIEEYGAAEAGPGNRVDLPNLLFLSKKKQARAEFHILPAKKPGPLSKRGIPGFDFLRGLMALALVCLPT